MKTLSEQEYETLVRGSDVLEQDADGSRVSFLSDGSILKIFSRKPFLSSETLLPYAKRFARNAANLIDRNVWTVTVRDVCTIKHLGAKAVRYDPILADTLRSLENGDGNAEPLVKRFAEFVAQLHDRGIYFRSIHLANIIVGDDGKLGLIDIADCRFQRRPLNFRERFRNLAKVYRYPEDVAFLRRPGRTFFY